MIQEEFLRSAYLLAGSMKFRSFSTLLLVVIVIAQSAMIGMVYWTSTVSNDLAKQKSTHLVEQAVQAARSNLSILTYDYGLWDQAFDWISARADEAVFEGIGVSATDGPYFHEIYLLDGFGTPIYAYKRDGAGSDLYAVDKSASDYLYRKVQELPVEPYDVISGFDDVNGNIAIVAAGRVQPRDTSQIAPSDLPVMVAVNYVNEEMLSTIKNSLLLEGEIALSTASNVKTSSTDALMSLYGLEDTVIATLTWDSPRPGVEIFRRSLPIALLISLILLAVTFAAVSLIKKRTNELEKAELKAETDPLTGLLNRAGLENLIRSKRGKAALKEGNMALIYLDLNGFKELNDRAGHKAGDAALLGVAEKLKTTVRPTDGVARLGGDEFVCVLFDRLDYATIESISNRCAANIKRTISIGKNTHNIDAAVGVAIAQTPQDFDKLLSDADSAMYKAKQQGSIQPVFSKRKLKFG